jgi:hypothetical protein
VLFLLEPTKLIAVPLYGVLGTSKMVGIQFSALVSLAGYVVAQSGVDLDKPMLGGGGRRGPGAMLRFGCSQVSSNSMEQFVLIL